MPDSNNPESVQVWSNNTDTVAATFLALMTLALLVALLRSHKRYRELAAQMVSSAES